MIKVSREVPAPSDIGTDVIAVPQGSTLQLELRLEAVMEGVLVSGSVRGHAVGECGRCLIAVEQDVEADVQELYAYSDKRPAEDVDEDDVRELEGDHLDLEPAVLDSLVPVLPFQPVCREDCPGLCSECGVRLADHPGHHHDVVDPRWSALQGLGADPAPAKTDAQREN
ncbi:YceD family protein [Angustibacter aerolatus]